MAKEKEVETDIKKQMDLWDKEFFVWFTIRANRTPDNEASQEAFKEFCKAECDNNYTLGLKKLLEYYQGDFKYEQIFMLCQDLLDRVTILEEKLNKPIEQEEEEDGGAF